ncbi:hypothetical protein [Desulforhopalus sp. 52FAK]
MVQACHTFLFGFVLYLACMVSPLEIIAGESSFLKIYQGGYKISRQQDFPIVGSTALVFKLNCDFPPKKVIEFYDNIFEVTNTKPFDKLSATRKWRTYHKYYKGKMYRTNEYLASWWDTENNFLYSLNLRYTTLAKVTTDTTELSISLQQVPFTEDDYSMLQKDIATFDE